MTTSTISLVPKLCDNCQQIDLSAFLPCTELEFLDTSGCYGGENKNLKAYVREPNGSLIDVGLANGDVFLASYELDLGPLEAIVARQEMCPLCHFIATIFKEFHEQEGST
jgi:hypothetical protein